LSPQQNARAQPVRLNKCLHEADLIDARFQEKTREFDQFLLAQIAAAVQVVAARQIACREVSFVGSYIASKPARNGPHAAGIEKIKQHRMRHQASHATIAVQEWVYPEQSMVSCGSGNDGLCLAWCSIDVLESLEKAGKRPR